MAFTYMTNLNQKLDLAGTGDNIVVAVGDNETITSGAFVFGLAQSPTTSSVSNNTVYLAGTGSTFTGSTGRSASDHVAVYGNNDTVQITAGNVDYYGNGGTVTATGFRIADSQYSMGHTDIVAHGTGSLYAVATPGGSMNFIGDAGYYVIDGRDSHATNIDLGKGGGIAAGGAERAPYTPGNSWSGTSTLKAGTGDQGSVLYGAAHGNNTLISTGHATVGMEGGQFANNVLDASQSTGNNWLEGYQGPATPDATTTNNNPGSTRMIAGSGNDILVPGAGNNVMVAGKGADNFLIFNDAANQVAGGNTALVQGFKQGTDHVGLYGFTGTTDAILAGAQHFGGNTSLRLQDGLQLTVAGVNLTAADVWRAG